MKKFLQIPLLLVALFLTSIPISAHDFEVDGIYYNILSSTTVEVTYEGSIWESATYTGAVTIPEIVINSGTSYSVTSIGGSAFYRCSGLTSVTIPNSVTSIGYYAFYGCSGLTSVTIPNSVTSIGYYAFYGCSGLTSVTIPNSVTEIGYYAFYGCSGLTSVTIPNSVTEIGSSAFEGCTGLTSVSIPNSVIKIGESAFENCSNLTNANIGSALKTIGRFAFSNCGLTEITIPTTTIEIGGAAFRDCNNLKVINYNAENCEYSAYLSYVAFGGCHSLQTLNIGNSVKSIPGFIFGNLPIKSLTIPNSVTDIGYYAFEGCSNLTTLKIPNSTNISPYAFIDCSGLLSVYNKASSLTTVTLNVSNRTNYEARVIIDKSFDNVEPERIIDVATGTAIISGLTPGAYYSLDAILAINAVNCVILEYLSVKTQKIGINFTGNSGVTKIDVSASFSSNKDLVDSCGFIIDHHTDNKFDNFTEKTFVRLDPNTEYVINFGAKNIAENVIVWSTPYTFTTGELVLTTQEAKPTSTTSVRLLAATNCDATEGTGFEWRRYDAPEELPSNKVGCPVVDGVLVGSLRGVDKEAYYKYRPYYTSSSGNTYYGDWVAFFTGDANVYFEPEVRTYEDIQVINNSATVKGYALEGTDVITAQGFEYWKTGTTIKPASTDDRMTVNASGISMSATLANLEYNSTYKYRAFVTTAKGTTYGDEMEFSTGEDPAGIGYIEVDGEEFSVTLRENPATDTAWVKILGVSGNEAQYVLTSISGAMVANGTMMLDGEWNAIELNCSAGMYLLTINDGSQVKTLRLIVK